MSRIKLLICAVCICLLFSGCNLWMTGEYHSVTPHLQQNAQPEEEQTACRSFAEVRDCLVDMVERGIAKGVIYTEGFTDKEMDYYMVLSVAHVTRNNAIGAYAVEQINYDIGTSAATPAIAVEITYTHSRSEILRIRQTENIKEAGKLITGALDDFSDSVVMFVKDYTAMDITQLVEDYVDNNPSICMEMPQVTVLMYPEHGTERVIEVSFTYQTSREDLRNMQENVQVVFKSAELYVQGDAEKWEKYSQLYSFLMERYNYTIETSITPAYSLLRHGVGDSKAFAQVYAQMCRQAGLDCQVVTGTKSSGAWYWNIIQDEGINYHIDLLACSAAGVFQPKMDEEMSGYVWDYSAYDTNEE